MKYIFVSIALFMVSNMSLAESEMTPVDGQIHVRLDMPSANLQLFPTLGPLRPPVPSLEKGLADLPELNSFLTQIFLEIENPIIPFDENDIERILNNDRSLKFAYKDSNLPPASKAWEFYNLKIQNPGENHTLDLVFKNFQLERLDRKIFVSFGENGDFRRACYSGHYIQFEMEIAKINTNSQEFEKIKGNDLNQVYVLKSKFGPVQSHKFEDCL